jgi:hypothetical protein
VAHHISEEDEHEHGEEGKKDKKQMSMFDM